jgi:hypothetical protein
MPVGCSIFSINSSVNIDDLDDELDDYEFSESHINLDDDLLTTAEEIRQTNRGVASVIYYDRPLQLGSRPGESSWAKDTHHANVRFVNNGLLSPGFITIGPKRKRAQIQSEIADILGINPETEIDLREISADTITQIIADDSKDSTFGWWEDVDSDTSSASVTGDIESSTHARNIDRKGKPTWVVFISDQYDMKVGVSRDNVVFYGEGWDHDMMEDYIYDIVLPKL